MKSPEMGSNPEETTPREKSAQLTSERINELTTSLEKDAEWGAYVKFLDSINSVNELEQVRKYIAKNNIKCDAELFDWYRDNLERWEDPEKELPTDFRTDFPLTSDKLDTPQKVRIFIRCADFCRVSPNELAYITESIIGQHETAGKDYVAVPHTPNYKQKTPEILAYFTQIQSWTLRKLLFPGLKRSGLFGEKLGFDWREQEDEK